MSVLENAVAFLLTTVARAGDAQSSALASRHLEALRGSPAGVGPGTSAGDAPSAGAASPALVSLASDVGVLTDGVAALRGELSKLRADHASLMSRLVPQEQVGAGDFSQKPGVGE